MTLALITGGSGHVGANLSRELINQGYKVRCIDYDNDYRAFENLDIELMKLILQIKILLSQLLKMLR